MKITSKLIIITAALLLPLMAGAQALKGSYFLDNSLNRNKMNPAFTPRSNYFQVPVLGNMSFGVTSNLDVPTFLYPSNGELLTFLNSQVSVSQFEKALPNHPHFDAEASLNVINFGFFTKQHSYWTFDLGMKALVDTDLPSDLFLFLKKGTGTTGQSYNIGNINAYASASVQAALGYSRDIVDGLRIGAKVRAIAPVAYAALNMDNMRLTTSKEKWTIESEGYLHTAAHGLDITPVEGEMMPDINFDLDRMLDNKALAGFGFSIDLGAEYVLDLPGELFDGISISASVTDLGAIRYKKDVVRSFTTEGKVDWVGIQNVGAGMDEMFDDLMESAKGLVNLKEGEASALTRSTMPSVYLGAEVPFLYKRMSVGLLYSGRFSHSYYRNELTASLNITPAKWFALGVNYSFLNTAKTIGGILEFTPKAGLNFFLGFDYLPLAYTSAPLISEEVPDFLSDKGFTGMPLPLSWRTNMHFGLAFSFGSKYGR
jgi:hypothetical protein